MLEEVKSAKGHKNSKRNIKDYEKEIEDFEKQFLLPLETSFDSGYDSECILNELDMLLSNVKLKPQFSSISCTRDTDCDSGAFSNCSTPNFTEHELKSPGMPLSVTNDLLEQYDIEKYIDSKPMPSCLSEAGKRTDISSQLSKPEMRHRDSELWRLSSILETRERRLPLLQRQSSKCHLNCDSEITVNGEHICDFAKL